VGPAQFNFFFQYSNLAQIGKFKMDAFPYSRNTQPLYDGRFEYREPLSQLDQLQIPNLIHVINSGIDSSSNLI
jgi:hypothetical protein